MYFSKKIKKPFWELESINDNKTITFSSRNSGCADFITIPTDIIARIALKNGLIVNCDKKGHFIQEKENYAG